MAVEDRVAALTSSGSPESVTLEYKRDPYPHTDGGRKEFAKDISAFANRDGGLLVIGVIEAQGRVELRGLGDVDVDAEIQWLESVARGGISPHLQGVSVSLVQVEGTKLIAVEVPRGFERPYEALHSGGRFFVREERSVRPMSREEIRSVVSNQISLSDKIDTFVDGRWQTFCNNGGPGKSQLIAGQGGCLLIVTPIFDQTFLYRANVQSAFADFPYLKAFHGRDGSSATPNIDGLRYTMRGIHEGKLHGFVQVYRHGVVEVADGYVWDRDRDNPLPGTLLCSSIIDSVKGALQTAHQITGAAMFRVDLFARHQAGTPIAFFSGFADDRQAADRDELLFDPLVLEHGESWLEDMPTILRPLLDQLWQAFGYINCGYFGESGEWRPPR